jgi:predicted HicB family RNase H-like nuclease
MVTVESFNTAIGHRITGGSPYGWSCFSPDARWLDSDHLDFYSANIVFDGPDNVYIAEVHDYKNERSYIWFNPEYKELYFAEAAKRGIDPLMSYDDKKFIELDVPADYIEKCTAIVAGNEYDTRIQIELDLEDEFLFAAMTEAHLQDITLNQYIEKALRYYIDTHGL